MRRNTGTEARSTAAEVVLWPELRLWQKQCDDQIADLIKRIDALEGGSSDSTGSGQGGSSPRVPTDTDSKPQTPLEKAIANDWTPVQMAANLTKNENKEIATHYGVSTANAELDIAIRAWAAMWPERDLCETLKADFRGMDVDKIVRVGTSRSSKLLTECLEIANPGRSEKARAQQIWELLNA